MSQLDALKLAEEMRSRAVNLATAENYIRDARIAKRAADIWAGPGCDGGLISDLWIQGAFPVSYTHLDVYKRQIKYMYKVGDSGH